MWKSHESERRLRDPIEEGRRDRSDVVYSSPVPARPNLPATGAPVTSPGFASRILGGFDGPLPPVEVDPAIEIRSFQ